MFAFVGRSGMGIHSSFGVGHRRSSKKPYRKGIIFSTIAVLVLVSGVIMTVLGFTDVFGAGMTMLGMLMIAVAILQGLYGLRMFLIASKLRHTERTVQISRGTVASMVIEREDEMGTLTVVMDAVNIEATCCRRSTDSNRPPDYNEATSDYYPESTGEIVIDTDGDPPPPYGPPTYDQAMNDKKEKGGLEELTDSQGEEQGEELQDHVTNDGQFQNVPNSNGNNTSSIGNYTNSDNCNYASTVTGNTENTGYYSRNSGNYNENYTGIVTVSPQEYGLQTEHPQEQMSHYQDLPSVTL